LKLEIVNRLRSHPNPEPESRGQGLKGMRERVEGCGGSLDWGSSTGGEFVVRACLPT
jgi:signal transduction histidine kinase